MSGKKLIEEVLTNPKVAASSAGVTTGSGIGTWLNYIPDDIGKLATLVGIVLSLVLIATWSMTFRKTRLEIEIMQRKEAERLAEIERRKNAGEPTRRSADS